MPSRRFVVFASLAFALTGAGCSRGLDLSSEDRLRETLDLGVSWGEAKIKGGGKMFGHALYRAATPVVFSSPKERFDPLKIGQSVVDRGVEPQIGSDAYFAAVAKGSERLRGLDEGGIVEVYVASDERALNDELEWANGFEARVAEERKTADFDKARRESVIGRVTPRKSDYRWTFSEPRQPVVDFSLFNPLDRAITGIDFDVDLLAPSGKVMASGLVRFRPVMAIEPEASGDYSVIVKDVPGFADPRFADLADPLAASMKVADVFVGDGESVMKGSGGLGDLDAQRAAIARLKDDIADRKKNLFVYRKVFL